MHKQGKFVTIDRTVRTLLPDKGAEDDFLILIEAIATEPTD
ncbi:MAG TPA: hypothetical protein VGH37_02160 [Candidatus Acidoferrum sp.]|jgi:hypothetical protein